MATTLVGIFDSVAEAERARQSLLSQGLARNAVHITDNESLMSRRGGSDVDETEHRGFFARLFGLGDDDSDAAQYSQSVRGGSALLTVTVEDESEARRVAQLLEQAGADDVSLRGLQGQSEGGMQRDGMLEQGETLQVMQEELQVGKRQVETGGVRIRQHVIERPVQEQIRLFEEHAIVERRPVDREASPGEIDALSMQDRELEIRERAEQAVVGKTARVVEEVRVGKEVTERTETIEDTVRRTDVDIEQLAAQQASQQQNNLRTPPPR